MPAFALVLVGFLFGWGLCTVTLTSVRPAIISFFVNARGPLKFNNLDWWRVDRRRRQVRLRNSKSLLARRRLRRVRRRFGTTVFVAAAMICCAEVLQLLHVQRAFDLEEVVLEPRVAILAVAATLGFVARAYRREAMRAFNKLLEIVLVSSAKARAETETPKADSPLQAGAAQDQAAPVPPKANEAKPDDARNKNTLNYVDSKFPWFVEVGIFASIVIMAVLLIDPALLRNLTSLKAGSLEAHFAAASGSATVESGQVVSVDLSRKTTTRGWTKFVFPGEKTDDPRILTYADSDKDNLAKSAAFFENYIGPLFRYTKNFDDKNLSIPLDAELRLRGIALQYATMILSRAPGLKPQQSPQELPKPPCVAPPIVLPVSWANDCPDEFGRRLSAINSPQQWDPYVIQAIGDLLFVVWDRRHQEDFLVAAAGDDSRPGFLACSGECSTAGQLSLIYDLVFAEVRSERPWPFSDMLSELRKALRGIDAVISKNDFEWRETETPKLHAETENLFRRNRLIDLTIGLELFYQRALRGRHFSPDELQTWRSWTDQTRYVMDLVEDDNVGWPPPFDAATLESWRRARGDIGGRLDLMQDALLGTALSLILIDASDGGPTPKDCVAARSLLERAKTGSRNFEAYAVLSPDDRGTYRGFLEQISASVGARCAP